MQFMRSVWEGYGNDHYKYAKFMFFNFWKLEGIKNIYLEESESFLNISSLESILKT